MRHRILTILVLLIASFLFESITGRANAQIASYCTGDVDLVWIVDIDRLSRAPELLQITKGQSLVDFVKNSFFNANPVIKSSWDELPQRDVIDAFLQRTSKIMGIAKPGFVSGAIVFEGTYDEDKLAKALRDWARKYQLGQIKIEAEQQFTRYRVGDDSACIVVVGTSTIIVGQTEFVKNICAKIANADKSLPDNRFLSVVDRQLADRKVMAAFAWVDSDRSMFGNSKDPTYDIERGVVQFANGIVKLQVLRDHLKVSDTKVSAANFKEELAKTSNQLANKKLSAELQRAMISQDDKRLTIEIQTAAENVADVLPVLLRGIGPKE